MSNTKTSYDVGTRCWYPNKEQGWIGGEITKNSFDQASGLFSLELKLENNEVVKIETKNLESVEANLNATTSTDSPSKETLPLLRNPPILESTEDLTSLSYLNEPAVLHAIKTRYAQLNIYTYSGIVLIATNPFDRVEQLYTQDMIQAYAGRRRGELEPHLFAIAEEAYRLMKTDYKNQTIVVSGESGAGKTVSAKYIMRYFASVEDIHNPDQSMNSQFNTQNGDSDLDIDGIPTVDGVSLETSSTNSLTFGPEMSETEEKILATNPIMEAFGNAKTTRNDNSSRFGKYLEILFNENTSIIGAKIRTYLLERSRLVFQPKSERNYHIFYQLLSGLNDEDKEKLFLKGIDDYKYTNQGGEPVIAGIDDKEEFYTTVKSLQLVGVNSNTQFEIFKILAGLLHIGNIEITKARNDAAISSEEANLKLACDLLGLDPVLFAKWLTKKQITTRSEKIISNLNYQQALVSKDSVAKYVYSCLFDWLVENINVTLCNPEVEDQVKTFIGVLDIYGFEHFAKNSFEQFCINYANEKLQQEFNQHVFKLEQEEYVKEKIEWSFIEFNDNQPCINLIENKLGILSLLDEESRLPAGSDQTFAQKLYETLDKPPTNKVFSKTRFGQSKFIVKHYALDVEYDSEGFIEKNRDTVSDGHLEVLKSSTNKTLLEVLSCVDRAAEKLANEQEQQSQTQTQSKPVGRIGNARTVNKKPTLGSIFKNSLVELMNTINSTNVHYIRCIKPNEEKEAWKFDNVMVLSQLRACGVLETIRISCAGFPTRWTYNEFVSRYHLLTPSKYWENLYSTDITEEDIKNLTQKVLEYTNTVPAKYQLGLTKVFFKAGMLANLERLRSDKLHESIVKIQKNVKKVYYQKQYQKLLTSIKVLQSSLNAYYVRQKVELEIKTNASLLIQSLLRSTLVKTKYNAIIESVIVIQSLLRMQQSKKLLVKQKEFDSAVKVQKNIRSFQPRKAFLVQQKSSLTLQNLIRRRQAQAKFRKMRSEAESVNSLKEVGYQLENKVIQLSETIAVKIKENKELNSRIADLQEKLLNNENLKEVLNLEKLNQSKELEFLQKSKETDGSEYKQKLLKAKEEMDKAKQEIDSIKAEKDQLKKDVQDKLTELQEARDQLGNYKTQNSDLQNEVNSLKEEIQRLQQSLQFASASSVSAKSNGVAYNNGLQETPKSNRLSISATDYIDPNTPGAYSDLYDGDDRSINSVLSQINDELYKLFDDTKALNKEIVFGLLKDFKVPEAGVAVEMSRKEVLYPARILIIILSDMWRLGLTKQSETFLAEVLSAIQNIVTNIKGDELIPNGAFWLTNVRELYSFVVFAENSILNDETYNSGLTDAEYEEYVKLVTELKDDFEALSYNIYNIWVKKLEKDLEKKVISAVVLSQSLPGFIANEGSQFLPKLFSQPIAYKMDDILTFLNNIYWSIKAYHVESEVFREVITTLLKFIDAICFNDLIMRRNFLSWKRGLQLNYNVTRLEEWCKAHYIQEGTECLVHMLQAAKLLQVKKATLEDIDIIWEICSSLKPAQIQKLISQYSVADYESPIPEEILQNVAERVKKDAAENPKKPSSSKSGSKSHSNDIFITVNTGPFDDPYATLDTREFGKIEAYIPAWLNLPITKKIVNLVTSHVKVQESGNI
ncbi:Myosin type-2 heavy chain 1 [Hanseniaspora osmophila]